MKRTLSLILAALLLASSLAACGKTEPDETTGGTTAVESNAPAETNVPATDPVETDTPAPSYSTDRLTENGMANPDEVGSDGCVHDEIRKTFLHDFLGGVKRAVDEGIPVLGYQHWSIMDNFEWAEGYGPRFGLVHVDYETQKRTIKDSAVHYAEIIRTNGNNL